MIVDFYHLVRSPLDRVLLRICERLLAQGERLIVVGDLDLLETLDGQLWSYAGDAFLPHGRAGVQAHDERQPILLSVEPVATNGARNIALVDGRWRDEALAFERAFYFFDDQRLDDARKSWSGLGDKAEVERRYWKQDERGKWVQGP